VRQVTESLGLQLVDIRATLLDAVDLRGIPRVEGDTVKWCPPNFLPREGSGVLLLDELGQAVPLVQASLLQLTLDRRIGEYQLPDGWTIIAASNRQEDRAGTHRLISPLLNRFTHIDAEVSHDDWQQWAVSAGVIPEVRSFIRFRPNLLFQFDPSTNPRAFPTPRSWSFVSSILPHAPKSLVQRLVAGCVGDGPAAEFYAFLQLYQHLPDVDVVLANPSGTSIPKEPAVVYALIGALVERVKKDKLKVGNFAEFAARLPEEFGMLAMRDILAVDNRFVANATLNRWVNDARKKGLFAGIAS
jgi:hypothetical protein